MSALLPKGDLCSTLTYVRFGPKADIQFMPASVTLKPVFRSLRHLHKFNIRHFERLAEETVLRAITRSQRYGVFPVVGIQFASKPGGAFGPKYKSTLPSAFIFI